jgi:predicted peroxiredoxin
VDEDRLLFPCTHGAAEPERATVPFIAASVAALSGKRATVVCTTEAVRIGTSGYAETIEEEGMPPLADLVRQLLDAGGELWLCSACTTKRGITGDDVIQGAEIVGAARIVEALAAGKALTLG